MEEVFYRGQAAWRSMLMIRRLLIAVVADAAALGILYLLHTQAVWEDYLLALVGVAVIALTVSSIKLLRSSALYVVGSGGVTVEEGFPIRTHSSTMSYAKIQVVDVRQTLVEKLILKTGDVSLETAAESPDGDQLVLRAIANPQRVASMIRQGEAQGTRVSWDDPQGHLPSWDRPAPSQYPQHPQYPQAPQQPPHPGGGSSWQDPSGPPSPWQ